MLLVYNAVSVHFLWAVDLYNLQILLTGDTMWSLFPLRMFTKVDGYKDGMPYLPASTTTSLERLFHYLSYIESIAVAGHVNFDNYLMQNQPVTVFNNYQALMILRDFFHFWKVLGFPFAFSIYSFIRCNFRIKNIINL